MDWSKTKNILIITFLVLNIFLLINVVNSKYDGNISKSKINNTIKILENSGVTLKDCSIPDKNINNVILRYTDAKFDMKTAAKGLFGSEKPINTLVSGGDPIINESKSVTLRKDNTLVYTDKSPAEAISLSNKYELEQYGRTIIKKMGFNSSEYYLDRYTETIGENKSITLTFRQNYKRFIVFDNYITATITEKGLTYLECSYKEPANISSRNEKVVPAYKILLDNMSSGNKAVIISIDVGFKSGYDEAKETNLMGGLVWRIKLEDGIDKYYSAIDGEEIKQDS
ncbi:MAG: two-component system regulatory protein YycI [Clostridia bacterium]|nr:two-component system regulatory protein YycI [Clostridia bacterium]